MTDVYPMHPLLRPGPDMLPGRIAIGQRQAPAGLLFISVELTGFSVRDRAALALTGPDQRAIRVS